MFVDRRDFEFVDEAFILEIKLFAFGVESCYLVFEVAHSVVERAPLTVGAELLLLDVEALLLDLFGFGLEIIHLATHRRLFVDPSGLAVETCLLRYLCEIVFDRGIEAIVEFAALCFGVDCVAEK